MIRIICIGNRYVDSDSAGAQVYDHLISGTIRENIEVIDGGLAGLNLLGLVDGADRVVFVDAVSGYAKQGCIAVLGPGDLPAPEAVCDHASGLPYLLAALPHACDRTPREIFLVGIEGKPTVLSVAMAAETAVKIACAGISAAGAAACMESDQCKHL